jgi:VWFA-related protein
LRQDFPWVLPGYALLVISDGGANASTHTLPQTLKLAEQSTAMIHTVGMFDEDDPDRNPKLLRRLADTTGGLAFFPSRIEQATKICRGIAPDIRNQYTIACSPTNPAKLGDYRAIRLAAAAPHQGKWLVRTRTGYIAAGGPYAAP